MNSKLELFDGFRRRMEDHFALVSIDNDLIAGASALVEITQADDCRKPQPARDDGHVRSPTTRIRRDRFHVI